MFDTRLYRISANDAFDRRKLWEGWLQWANRFSRLDSDSIARSQFDRENFSIDAFIEMFHAGLDVTDDAGLVSNESGTIIAASKKIISLDIAGDYWVNWSIPLKAKSGDCRFVSGVPFVGNQIVGSAQDFKAELGWYNNSDITESVVRGPEWGGVVEVGEDFTPYEMTYEDWDSYGKYGLERHSEGASASTVTVGGKDKITSQLSGGGQEVMYYHLSGSGSAMVGRITGNIGILLFCQSGSEFNIVASRLTLRRRNK
mgnify:CR=1 FL=1